MAKRISLSVGEEKIFKDCNGHRVRVAFDGNWYWYENLTVEEPLLHFDKVPSDLTEI